MATKPGVIPLRPLGLGEILDGAFSYIRANPLATLGISAVVITITQLVQVPATGLVLSQARDAAAAGGGTIESAVSAAAASFSTSMVSGLVSFLATTVLTGLLIVVLGQAVLGRTLSISAAWAAARRRIPGLLGVTLLTTLAIVALLLIGALPLVFGVLNRSSALSALAILTLPVSWCAALFLGVSWSLVPPAYVLEGIPAMSAFGRSFGLVRRHWWRMFGILALAYLVVFIVSLIIGVPFGLGASVIDGSFAPGADPFATPSVLALVLSALGTIIASTITAPFMAGVTGLLYFDQRIRKEAFDIQLQQATRPW